MNRRKRFIIKTVLILLLILLALGGCAGAAFLYLSEQGRRNLNTALPLETVADVSVQPAATADPDEYVMKLDGKCYCFDEDLINILLLGVDRDVTGDGHTPGKAGQADSIMILSIGQTSGKASVVTISRECMADIRRYDEAGTYAGTDNMQICLAYAYGSDGDSSCLNTANAASCLLYGVPIHAYAAIDYRMIPALNDLLGGVSLTVLEDLSAKDPVLKKGSHVTLTGEQAVTYVRSRDTSLLESNKSRMKRQKQYALAYLRLLAAAFRQEPSIIAKLYETVSPGMATSLEVSDLAYLASVYFANPVTDGTFYELEGEIREGSRWAEFYPDEDMLRRMVADVFMVDTGK